MTRTCCLFAGWLVLSLTVAMAGCSQGTKSNTGHEHDHHDHDHEALGPHGGHLIELGDEAYHGELTHDDPSHKVAIYLLDGAAKAMPAAAELPAEVKLSFDDKGKSVDYTLAKVADGKYEIVNEALCTLLGGNFDVNAKLVTTIAGKPFTGTIEHHAHKGHNHDHHDHDHDHAHDKPAKK
jgi:hypothetical protein